jgi:hypothetical protein
MEMKITVKKPKTEKSFKEMLKTAQRYMSRGWNETGKYRGTYSYYTESRHIIIIPPGSKLSF